MRSDEDPIGSRIKEFRKRRGWSQETLAEAVELTQQQIRNYETGKSAVSVPRARRIADALRVNVHDLVCGGPGATKPAEAGLLPPEKDREFFEMWLASKNEWLKNWVIELVKHS